MIRPDGYAMRRAEKAHHARGSSRNLVLFALAAAILSLVMPFVVRLARIDDGSVMAGSVFLSLALSGTWLVMTIRAIAKYRARGFWAALGLLPALFMPFVVSAVWYACHVNQDCL
jgi:hypothetical protein